MLATRDWQEEEEECKEQKVSVMALDDLVFDVLLLNGCVGTNLCEDADWSGGAANAPVYVRQSLFVQSRVLRTTRSIFVGHLVGRRLSITPYNYNFHLTAIKLVLCGSLSFGALQKVKEIILIGDHCQHRLVDSLFPTYSTVEITSLIA